MSTANDLAIRLRAGEYQQAITVADLAVRIGATPEVEAGDALARIRVSALAMTVEAFGLAEAYLPQIAAGSQPAAAWEGLARAWQAMFVAMRQASVAPTIDDLLLYAAVLINAGRTPDVRGFLSQEANRGCLAERAGRSEWMKELRAGASRAALLLLRQESAEDIRSAIATTAALADASHSRRSPETTTEAFTVLAMYHAALAVEETANYALTGSSEGSRRVDPRGFYAELRNLLVKAEEYASNAGDADVLLLLSALATVLWETFRASIWTSAHGIEEQIDRLLAELAQRSTDPAIFSLLPSQREAIRAGFLDRSSSAIVLEMPTSSGKTLLAEFAIVQALQAYRDQGARAIYLCPTRALVTQVARTLSRDFAALNIPVVLASSAFEEDPFEAQLLDATQGVIVATPEKVDLLLRAQPDWFDKLRLVVVDEAHLLKESHSERGVRLELLLANLRREQPDARLILLTPFVENADEVATWLSWGGRATAIKVEWRPSRTLLGLVNVLKRGKSPSMAIEWREPRALGSVVTPFASLELPPRGPLGQATLDVAVDLVERFAPLGTVLAVFTASKTQPEVAARRLAEARRPVDLNPSLRVAIALARDDYGEESELAYCLERGVAFHHAALSPTLRFLIEDQIRVGKLGIVCATTTLAQGMNFPVTTVVMHSLHKPYGRGDLSPAEFWNIAGRAGRLGLADTGIVLFANDKHREKFEYYAKHRVERIRSALVDVLARPLEDVDLKREYKDVPAIRPFMQYLLHAVATQGPYAARTRLEELIEGSLANIQVEDLTTRRRLRTVAIRYLSLLPHNQGLTKTADTSGLGHFSFNELFGKIGANALLAAGPANVRAEGERGLRALIEALQWLPELNLAIGYGKGRMNVRAVAQTVQGWIDGRPVSDLARLFPGDKERDRIRAAGTYLYDTVSQTISWGAYAYAQGWWLRRHDLQPTEGMREMLPSLIQFGVRSDEAAVVSLFGIPRVVAEQLGDVYRRRHGALQPERVAEVREFLVSADRDTWSAAVDSSRLRSRVDAGDLREVWRQMTGLRS